MEILSYRERRQARSWLTAQMTDLVDGASRENRDFTSTETAEFDRLKHERSALDGRQIHIGSKAELIDALHDVGLSRAAADRVAAGGWPALAVASVPVADLTSIQDRLADIAAKVRG